MISHYDRENAIKQIREKGYPIAEKFQKIFADNNWCWQQIDGYRVPTSDELYAHLLSMAVDLKVGQIRHDCYSGRVKLTYIKGPKNEDTLRFDLIACTAILD